MKKLRILFMAGLAFMCLQANAQTMGLKAGLNVANIGGDAEGVEARLGYHAGLFFNSRLSDTFGFQPEIVFSSQGAQSEATSDLKLVYNYLNFPLIFKFYANDNFTIQAGPQLGLLVSAKAKLDDEETDLKDQLETFDFSMGFGLGYEVNNLHVVARYNLGLTSTASDSGGSYPNQVIQIGLGFGF